MHEKTVLAYSCGRQILAYFWKKLGIVNHLLSPDRPQKLFFTSASERKGVNRVCAVTKTTLNAIQHIATQKSRRVITKALNNMLNFYIYLKLFLVSDRQLKLVFTVS